MSYGFQTGLSNLFFGNKTFLFSSGSTTDIRYMDWRQLQLMRRIRVNPRQLTMIDMQESKIRTENMWLDFDVSCSVFVSNKYFSNWNQPTKQLWLANIEWKCFLTTVYFVLVFRLLETRKLSQWLYKDGTCPAAPVGTLWIDGAWEHI